jgi:hypothetical protein
MNQHPFRQFEYLTPPERPSAADMQRAVDLLTADD